MADVDIAFISFIFHSVAVAPAPASNAKSLFTESHAVSQLVLRLHSVFLLVRLLQ